jgi:hypothetical protein
MYNHLYKKYLNIYKEEKRKIKYYNQYNQCGGKYEGEYKGESYDQFDDILESVFSKIDDTYLDTLYIYPEKVIDNYIKLLKNANNLEPLNWTKVDNNNGQIIDTVIENIDLNKFKELEIVSAMEISNYITKIISDNFNKNDFEKYVEYSQFAFIPSDVVEKYESQKNNKLAINDKYEIYYDVKATRILDDIQAIDFITGMVAINEILNNSDKKIKIYFMMNDAKKQIDYELFRDPFSKSIISQRHLNSAEYNPTFNKLNLFRSEEIDKVLIHEFLHLNEYDKYARNYNIQNNWNFKKTSGNILINESIVEATAQVLNILVVLNKKNILNHAEIKKYFNKEIKFGLFQTAKILWLFDFKKVDDLLNPKNDNKIIESSSGVEYHIYKTILLLNYDRFIKYHNDKNVDGIMSIINDTVKNIDYQKIVNMLITFISLNYKLNEFNILIKTMRMSIVNSFNL